jgi:hypothetical protein
MITLKNWAYLYALIFLFVVFYFIFNGFTTVPWEGDSLAYHLPIAENIVVGKFSGYDNLLYYYPASVHVLLALLMIFQIPLQLFNVYGIIFLFLSLYLLGRRFNLEKNWAIIFSVVVVTLTPLMRLIGTQTVDIYLAAFYALTLALLLKPNNSFLYALNLGLVGGMLIGAKFTGPLFAVLLVPFFITKVLRKVDFKWIICSFFIAMGIGGGWYLRNLILMGDLLYPANHPDFTWVKWHTWQTIVQKEGGLFYFLESLFSEYLIWPLTIITLPYVWIKKQLSNTEAKLLLIGLGNFIIHVVIPASPDNVLSDMRYTVPTFICLLLVLFSYVQRKKKQVTLAVFCTIPLLSSFTLVIPHRPKLFVVFSFLLLVGYVIKQKNPLGRVGS